MGEFLRIDSKQEKNEFGMKNILPRDIYIEFVPGLVLDVVINGNSPAFTEDRDINSIIAKKHYGPDTKVNKSMIRNRYYPLLRGMVDVPIKGDQVLLCNFGGI